MPIPARPTVSQTPFEIPVRKDLEWDFSETPRHFVDADPFVSFLWAALSAGAPPIETFFIKALLPTLESITEDEKLSRDVRNMVAQEGQHASVHRLFNRHLQTLGYDIDTADARFRKAFDDMTRGLGPKDILGVVAAGEHLLYSFALVFLQNERIRDSLHPQARRLFHFHLMEEAEHAAVSHDQYLYFAGHDYRHRVKTAARAARHVFSMIDDVIAIFAAGFGVTMTMRNRWNLFVYQWITPGLSRKMVARLFEYVTPWYRLSVTHEDAWRLAKWNAELYATQPSAVSPRA